MSINLKDERIGQKRMCCNNLWIAECVEYINCDNIIIRIYAEVNGVIYNIDKKTKWETFDRNKFRFSKIEINGIIYKKCTVCKEILPIDKFNKKDGKCKECQKIYNKQYKKEHMEEILKYTEEHKEEIAEYRKQYDKENPHVRFNSRIRRRSKLENQGKGITKDQWKEMFDFFDWRCAYSNEYVGGRNNKNISIDHIIPLNSGGLNEIWNLVPMYMPYNSSKQDKSPIQWYKSQSFFSEERLNKIIEWQIYAYNKWATEEDEELVLITNYIDDDEEIA